MNRQTYSIPTLRQFNTKGLLKTIDLFVTCSFLTRLCPKPVFFFSLVFFQNRYCNKKIKY